jgi:hypothetical protein
MEEKIIRILIDEYKARGIDVTAVIDNPLFKDMSLDNKLDLIKKFASHISSHTSKALTKKEIGAVVLDSAMSGLTTGGLAYAGARQVASYFKNPNIPASVIAIPIAMGVAATGISSYFGARKYINDRKSMAARFDAVAKDPSDENALKVLINRQGQLGSLVSGGSLTSKSMGDIKNNLNSIPRKITEMAGPEAYFKTMAHNYGNSDVEFADGKSHEEVEREFDKSHEDFMSVVEKMRKNMFGG